MNAFDAAPKKTTMTPELLALVDKHNIVFDWYKADGDEISEWKAWIVRRHNTEKTGRTKEAACCAVLLESVIPDVLSHNKNTRWLNTEG